MTLQQLRYFCVMAEVLHYTKAANQLYISQPSLSYALAELEKEVGVPLFEKQGKKTFLTKYGETFLPYAQNALHELSDGVAKLCQMSDPTVGHVNLGYIYSIGFDFLPKIIEDFHLHQGNRNITFNFHQSSSSILKECLLSGSLDLALTSQLDDPQIEAVPIFNQELFLAVSNLHPLAGRSEVSLEEIRDEQFISINHNSSLRIQVDSFFHANGIDPKIVFEVYECTSMAALVSAQMGIAIMPRIPLPDSYKVSLLHITAPQAIRTICLSWRKDYPIVPSAQCFRDFVLHKAPDILTPESGF